MIEIDVRQTGIEVSAISIPRVGAELVREVTKQTYHAVRARAPVRTGRLRDSITQRVTGLSGEVRVGAPYAAFVELGTRSHLIHPVRASALRFEAGGNIVFSKLVRHPGTKPNPFIRRAVDLVKNMIHLIFLDVWKREVK